MGEDTIIQFKNVSKAYGERFILRDFNLKIHRGEFITVIGSSGSGKTTMLKMINGLLTPTSGSVYVEGKDISRENQTLLRRNIGYVIQGIGLFPHMTVWKNIAYETDTIKSEPARLQTISSGSWDLNRKCWSVIHQNFQADNGNEWE